MGQMILSLTWGALYENCCETKMNNLRVLGGFRPQKAWKALRCSGRRNRQQLITRRSLVQVQPPQPQNRLILQEIRRFFFTFCPQRFPEKLCDFAKFAVDPNRDPYGSKMRLGAALPRQGFPAVWDYFLLSDCRRQDLFHGFCCLLLSRRSDMGVGVQREAC